AARTHADRRRRLTPSGRRSAPARSRGRRFCVQINGVQEMATTAITADQVKQLRDKTGAGMMECKAALADANGNMEEAITILRKRGLAQAAKRAGRTTA